MRSKSRWDLPDGSVVIKYRMAGIYEYLKYNSFEELEGGDFISFKSLKEAKTGTRQND